MIKLIGFPVAMTQKNGMPACAGMTRLFVEKKPLSLARIFFGLTLGLVAAAAVGAAPVQAAEKPADDANETLISAQNMHNDPTTGTVTASGKVEISRNGYILHADQINYNQQTGIVHAEGHVALLTPSGEVQFADSQDITGDMKDAFVQNLGILFPDNSRLAARSAQRYEGRYVVADQAMYTACNVCKENPDNPPLWQLRAKQVVHDNEAHDIYYHNATIDLAGVPVLYTPYLSTPDPTVERRQGFLSPRPGYSSTLGANVRVPYYFDIAPTTDAVLAPTFSEIDRLQMEGEFRHRFDRGSLVMNGSVTHTDLLSDGGVDQGKQWRGHLFSNFVYNIDNVWRAGSDVNFASDKSYLPRYRITGGSDQLTTRNYVEGFSGRNYAAINQYYFEDLRPGTQAVQPIVLPQAMFSAYGEPGKTLGGRWSLDGNMLMTARDNAGQSLWQQGPDTRRLAMNGGWERQLISSSTGLVTKLSGLLHLDSYWADNVVNPNGSGNIYNNVTFARHFEQANAQVSYPMSRSGNGYQQYLEPIVAFTAAPTLDPRADQPIEDSRDVTFDASNLFAPNRYTGYDLIEGGSRVTYGLRHTLTTDNGGRITMFGGQSYDFSDSNGFGVETGLHDHQSDYVGAIEVSPADWLTASYNFRLDYKTLEPQRQYANASFGVPAFRPFVRYSSGYTTNPATGLLQNVDDATFGFNTRFAKYWNFYAAHTQGFNPQPGPRGSTISLGYGDECLIFALQGNLNNTQRLDVNSGTSVVFHVFLRNFGGIQTDGTNSANFPTEFRQTD